MCYWTRYVTRYLMLGNIQVPLLLDISSRGIFFMYLLFYYFQVGIKSMVYTSQINNITFAINFFIQLHTKLV